MNAAVIILAVMLLLVITLFIWWIYNSPSAEPATVKPQRAVKFDTGEVKRHAYIATEPNPYTPQQVASVYAPPISPVFDGVGQKIAIIGCYTYDNIQKDFDKYCSTFGIPQSKLTVISMGTRKDNGWPVEMALDTQWARVFANRAEIMVILAKDANFSSLKDAINKAISLKANIVSMSLGAGESSYAISHLESVFANNPNVIFLASSGDDPSVSYPSSSPNVISVGGTRLYIKDDGFNSSTAPKLISGNYTKIGETDWVTPYNVGTGFGLSEFFPRPSFQKNANHSQFRSTPDISLISATPSENGVAIYCTAPGSKGWMGVQGTSVSCPCLAGMIATANSARLSQSKKMLTKKNILDALYALQPSNFPVDTMANGVGFVNNKFIPFLVSL